MKQLRTFLVTLAVLLCTSAWSQNPIYEKYNENKQVSSVYISKAMLEMNPKPKNIYIEKVTGKLEAVYIVTTMHPNVQTEIKKDIDNFVKKEKYELLMKQQGTTSGSSFYMKKKGDKIKELIMVTVGTTKLNFVHLVGDLTLNDIQRITNMHSSASHLTMPIDFDEIQERIKMGMKKFEEVDFAEIKKRFSELDFSWAENLNN